MPRNISLTSPKKVGAIIPRTLNERETLLIWLLKLMICYLVFFKAKLLKMKVESCLRRTAGGSGKTQHNWDIADNVFPIVSYVISFKGQLP